MKILVVDDSSTIRSIAHKELVGGGYEVVEAVDGEDALAKVVDGSVDLISMDIEMPRMDGYEAFAKMRSEGFAKEIGMIFQPPPVIFVTARDSLEERKRGFNVGAADFITKPFLPGDLLASVNRILKPENKYEGLNALVVDDSRIIRSLLREILKKEGMNIFEAEDGKQAFEIFRSHVNTMDLVIADYQMPNMTGIELLRKIRIDLNHKGVPIIVLSASAEQADILELFKSGVTDYLNKPFPKEELLARIRVHLDVRLLNRRLSKQLDRMKKLGKLKDDFLAICSHDLRGPLGAIRGYAELLRDPQTTPAEVKEFAVSMESCSNFLLTLVNDLLDLGKIQSENEDMELIPMQLAQYVKQSMATLKTLAQGKGIDLTLEDTSSPAMNVSGNAAAMARIVNNLLSNAIKFTAKNGKVRLVLAPEGGNSLALSVIDSGVGIPAAKIPALFQKYSKASRPGTEGERGTGLGLPIVKELVERQGGTIEVNSKEGQGSTFRVTFPLLALLA